jgi:hypothetical protein
MSYEEIEYLDVISADPDLGELEALNIDIQEVASRNYVVIQAIHGHIAILVFTFGAAVAWNWLFVEPLLLLIDHTLSPKFRMQESKGFIVVKPGPWLHTTWNADNRGKIGS